MGMVLTAEDWAKLISKLMGYEYTAEDFRKTGERIYNLERMYLLREGFTRADDSLPGRCFEPVKGEHSEEAVMKHDQFESMLDEYYTLRGWTKNGVPSDAKLRELGIEEYTRLAES